MTEKILIIQTAFIGDAILTLPMIQKLDEMFPNCIIDVVAIPSTKAIFDASPYVNSTYVMEKRGKHKSLFKLRKFAKELGAKNYSRLYSPHRSLRSSLLVMMCGIINTYGFSTSEFKYVYKNIITYFPEKHEVQRNFDLIGYSYDDDSWRIAPKMKGQNSSEVQKIIARANNKKIASVAPGSIWNTKRYPIDYYLKVIDYLVKMNFFIVLIGGKDDVKDCGSLTGKIKDSSYNAAGELSFAESVALLEKSELLICNDSAPAHLGQAANTKTLMLYCSTVPDFGFAPYLSGSDFLSYNDLKCKPCGIHGYKECPIKTFECGIKLIPEMVISKLKENFIL